MSKVTDSLKFTQCAQSKKSTQPNQSVQTQQAKATSEPVVHHQQFLQTLSGEERRHLTSKTNSHAVIRLALLLTLQVALASWVLLGWAAWPIALLPLGILNISMFHLMHECIHWTAFRTRFINQLIALCCGFVLLLSPTWFRFFHVAHHRHTQDLKKDPELLTAKPDSRFAWLIHISGLRIWLDSSRLLLGGVAGKVTDDFIPTDQRATVVKEIRLMVAGYALLLVISVVLKSSALLWIWLLPNLLGQPFLRLYLLAEHGNCALNDNMFANTRTVFTHPAIRWFTWNMSYHTEHHVYAAVPFHRLPDLHVKIQDKLLNTSDGYVAFNNQYYDEMSA